MPKLTVSIFKSLKSNILNDILDFADPIFGSDNSDYFQWSYDESSGHLTNLKTGALLTRSSDSVVLSNLLTDSGQDQEWLLDYNGKTESSVKSLSLL